MTKARTNEKRPGNEKSSRHPNRFQYRQAMDHAVILIDTVCLIAGSEHLLGDRSDKPAHQLRAAIADHNTALLFERLVEAFSMQGISDHVAFTYMEQHGRVTWRGIGRMLESRASCPKLQSYWAFHGCGYEKARGICAEPNHLGQCPLPLYDLRNGRLNVMAFSLFRFIRDVADNDLVRWIDHQLAVVPLGPEMGAGRGLDVGLEGLVAENRSCLPIMTLMA